MCQRRLTVFTTWPSPLDPNSRAAWPPSPATKRPSIWPRKIAGSEDAQRELYGILLQIYDAGKQIVLAGDRPPKAIAGLHDRLRSRFEWGLIVELQPPDLQTRIAILQEKVENQSVPVPKEVIDYIAGHAPNNMRELEGSLARVTHLASKLGSPVTLELVIASQDANAG